MLFLILSRRLLQLLLLPLPPHYYTTAAYSSSLPSVEVVKLQLYFHNHVSNTLGSTMTLLRYSSTVYQLDKVRLGCSA